jgi:hypothetical protein
MKTLFTFLACIFSVFAKGQSHEYFKKFDFDSNYSVVGIGSMWGFKIQALKNIIFTLPQNRT